MGAKKRPSRPASSRPRGKRGKGVENLLESAAPGGTGISLEAHAGGAPVVHQPWHYLEGLLLTFFFGVMLILPLLDIVGRKFHINLVPGSLNLVQHSVLAIMMFGAAIAAREGKLLALSSTANLIPDRFKTAAHIFTAALGAAITLYLAQASFQYSMMEKEVGDIIAMGIPKWFVLFFLPAGFLVVFIRMIWRSADKMWERALTLALALGMASLGLWVHNPPHSFLYFVFAVLLFAVVMGTPVFVALGGAALFFLWNSETPIASIPAETYRMVVSPTIPNIPLFTLTGYLLAEGGASKRLLRVFQAWFGSLRGGPAIVTALVCAFFTCFTGGSGVTILALGGLLMPILLAEKYKERDALGLLTSAGSLGMLFPPSLPVILYGVVSHTAIDQLFLAGILPGLLLLAVTALWGVSKGSKSQAARHPFHLREALEALWVAKWELLLPFVIFFFLFGVKVTLVESAALTALYAFVIEVFIYRDLKLRYVPKVITECGILVGGVLLILGVSLGFTNDMVDAQIPAKLAEWVKSSVHSQWVFLLMVNIMLILVAGLLEIFAAIVVVVPLLMPMAEAFGVDPVHMGIIFLANMELGFLMPPLGLNLFLSSYRFKKPMIEVYRSVLPMLALLYATVILITYVPFFTTAIPKWFSGTP
jgi:C4-dicarboxylate transporter, DctM subunit